MSLALALFALVALVDATDNTTQCPNGCKCNEMLINGYHYSGVVCGLRETDVEHLTGQSYTFLSVNHFVENLISLFMLNTSLPRVPASVCQLPNLRELYLDGNNLTEVPYDCLTNLSRLLMLSASRNAITGLNGGIFDGLQNLKRLYLDHNRIGGLHDGTFKGLQSLMILDLSHNRITGLHDGTFDGLQSLGSLDLSYNGITFIGIRVFSNSSVLTRLRVLDLSYNKLTSLEPWWYYRCILGSMMSPVVINLNHNLISNFTNKLQFDFDCNMTVPFGFIDLGGNPITHFMDILNGWNMTLLSFFKCVNYNPVGIFFTIFYIRGLNLACDCNDFELFQKARNRSHSQTFTILRDVHCKKSNVYNNTPQSVLTSKVPLSDFVCHLSDHCPPSCQCVYRPENTTLHVNCSASNLSSLPFDLPPLPKSYVIYKLDFS